MKSVIASGVVLLVAIFAVSAQGSPIVNPSFETGDTTGWYVTNPQVVNDGTASDGQYYWEADPNAWWLDFNGGYPLWVWEGEIEQQGFTIPGTTLWWSVDIRKSDSVTWFGEVVNASGSHVFLAPMSTPAPNGFSRYRANISSIVSSGTFTILIEGGAELPGDTQVIPPITFDVDNVQFTPEPAKTSLLLLGGLALLRPRRAESV